jgi:hypothetical protein
MKQGTEIIKRWQVVVPVIAFAIRWFSIVLMIGLFVYSTAS